MDIQANKGPIVVQSFHYDVVDALSPIKTEVQVELQDYEPQEKEENAENAITVQVMTPFDIHPEGTIFAISGLVGQVVQLINCQQTIDQLDAQIVQQLSQPLIEQIQILTYQVTAITLDQGYHLEFNPQRK